MISPVTPAELEVNRIRDLSKGGRHAEALAAAEALVLQFPTHRDGLYLVAANQRCLQRARAALVTLERLERQHPHFALLYQERGYCLISLRDVTRALEAFQTALSLNPLLPASWSMVQQLTLDLGHSQVARLIAGRVAALGRLPPQVAQLINTLAHQRDMPEEAERLLRDIVAAAPEFTSARLEYVRVLIERQKYLPARAALALLPPDESNTATALTLHAATCAGIGEYQQAISIYRQLLADTPGQLELHLPLAHCLKASGRTQEAVESYQAATHTARGYADACWSLANLKTYAFSASELTCMRQTEAAPATPAGERSQLCFALGKALEDGGEYADSWRYYERGNELRRAASAYRIETLETNTRQQLEFFTAPFFAACAGFGSPAPDPILIVGLPRSGSTLIEQILASHSQVDGTQELAEIPGLIAELQGPRPDPDNPRYPAVLARLTAEDFRSLGERYLACTRIYRRGRARFLDKMPNNFRHVGLIHLMLPNARIIDVRREPLACCLSNFKQLFAGGQDFTYSLSDLGRYYRSYLELMTHWQRVLPGKILRVHYEDVVADLEGNVRRLLEFCGLDLEPACLEFYKTQRNIGTPSSEQVRQPIFRSGLEQWRHYEPWLAPLQEALGDAVSRYRD